MDGQEDADRDREGGEARLRELKEGSRQGSEENSAPGGSVENGAERAETAQVRTQNRHELPSGDTGFFETSEDFGEIGIRTLLITVRLVYLLYFTCMSELKA